jgi:protein-tyrosine kinase
VIGSLIKSISGGDGTTAKQPRSAAAAWTQFTTEGQDASFSSFEIDFDRLAKNGFISPRSIGQPVSGDIRIIKRRLLRRLNFLRRHEAIDGDPRSGCPAILVTSSEPEEGKTFLAVNLALSFAMEERLRVILVDADLIKPSLASVFGLPAGKGLGDSFRDASISPAHVIGCAKQIPLGLVKAGTDTEAFAEALMGQSLAARLNRFAVAFDAHIVMVDGPPLLATTEAALLAEQVDEVVFVVRAGHTPAQRVTAALDLLSEEDRISLVLNRAPFTQNARSYRDYEPQVPVL